MAVPKNDYDYKYVEPYYLYLHEGTKIASIGGCITTVSGGLSIPESIEIEVDGVFKEYTITSIEQEAFKDCSNIREVTVPNSVTSIGQSAFVDCTSLISINLPESITEIGGNAFAGCNALTSITIPRNIIIINGSTFYGCKSLISVSISESVSIIGEGAFAECDALLEGYVHYYGKAECWEDINIQDGNIYLIAAKRYYHISDLIYIIENSVAEVFGCEDGAQIIDVPSTIGAGKYPVTEIGSDAFSYNEHNITKVVLSKNITTIGIQAFGGCSNLSKVYYKGSEEYKEQNLTIYGGNDCLVDAEWCYFTVNCKYKINNELRNIVGIYTVVKNPITDILEHKFVYDFKVQ